MARSIWTGSISFGLVNVPVRLYTAVSHKEISFHMLHKKDGGRIQFKRFCSVDGEEVPYDQIIKGYELSKGQYVTFGPEEIEKLDFKATHTIDIEQFVELNEIDPLYYDTTYYLAPDERGVRAYALLLRVMEKTDLVAVARIVMRTKQHLCALRPYEGILALSTMQYADEIVSASTINVPKLEGGARERELEMAEKLVESLTGRFEPEKYKDTYRERVLEMVEKKAAGAEVVAPEGQPRVETGNLADALAASLERTGRSSARPATGHRRAPAHVRPAARTRRRKA